MPKSLEEYLHEESFDSLFNRLIKNPPHMILFFETASEDETWCERNSEEVTKMIRWLNSRSLQRALPQDFSMRVADALRKHYYVLETFVPLDITVALDDGEVAVNSLLLCANSTYFLEKVQRDCVGEEKTRLALPGVSQWEFGRYLSYMRTGEIAGLPTASEEELLAILRRSQEWMCDRVTGEVQWVLRKYVGKDRALEWLQKALKEQWPIVAQEAVDILNKNESGYSFYLVGTENLGIALERWSEAAMTLVEPLKDSITSLTCGERTAGTADVLLMTKLLRRLNHLDLSRTQTLPLFLDRMPSQISSLTLAETPWLGREVLQKLATWFPHLTELSLANDTHLPSTFWSGLLLFKGIKKLDLSGCHQIGDAEFGIMLKSLGPLETLLAGRCAGVGDVGFSELARRGRSLHTLDLSRTRVSDRALVELSTGCPGLAHLDLTGCSDITEKGVLELVKNARELRSLDLERTSINPVFLEKLEKINPSIRRGYANPL